VVQFLNQHSFISMGSFVLFIMAIVLLRRRARRGWLIWGGLAVVLGTGWLLLRTGAGLQLNSVEDYEAALKTGRPTLVEFFSNY
jgi:hypothetical protein